MNRLEKEVNVLIKKKKDWLPVEQNSMELSLVFNTTKAEQKRGIVRRELGKGKYMQVSNPKDSELIRNEDLITLFSCFLLLKHSGKRKDHSFEVSYDQFFTLFGRGQGGGWRYERLKGSLDRLQANNITTNSWWDTINGERIVLAKFHFLDGVDEGKEKTLRISLSNHIVKSMEHGYLRWLEENDLKEILHLRKFARVLALFLLKRTNFGPGVKFSLDKVLDILGVKEKYKKLQRKFFNLSLKRTIIPAVEKAAKTIGYVSYYKKKEKIFIIEKQRKSLMG